MKCANRVVTGTATFDACWVGDVFRLLVLDLDVDHHIGPHCRCRRSSAVSLCRQRLGALGLAPGHCPRANLGNRGSPVLRGLWLRYSSYDIDPNEVSSHCLG